jgi:hypothetical protein
MAHGAIWHRYLLYRLRLHELGSFNYRTKSKLKIVAADF